MDSVYRNSNCFLSQVCGQYDTHSCSGGLSENSCMHPGKTTLALWSSMLIFFKRNAMSVRSKRHPVYKSSTEREGRGKKKFIFTETKGHLTFAFFITTSRSSSSLNFCCQIEIWEHVVFLDSTSIIKIAVACFEYFMI